MERLRATEQEDKEKKSFEQYLKDSRRLVEQLEAQVEQISWQTKQVSGAISNLWSVDNTILLAEENIQKAKENIRKIDNMGLKLCESLHHLREDPAIKQAMGEIDARSGRFEAAILQMEEKIQQIKQTRGKVCQEKANAGQRREWFNKPQRPPQTLGEESNPRQQASFDPLKIAPRGARRFVLPLVLGGFVLTAITWRNKKHAPPNQKNVSGDSNETISSKKKVSIALLALLLGVVLLIGWVYVSRRREQGGV